MHKCIPKEIIPGTLAIFVFLIPSNMLVHTVTSTGKFFYFHAKRLSNFPCEDRTSRGTLRYFRENVPRQDASEWVWLMRFVVFAWRRTSRPATSYAPDDTSFVYVHIFLANERFTVLRSSDNSWIVKGVLLHSVRVPPPFSGMLHLYQWPRQAHNNFDWNVKIFFE